MNTSFRKSFVRDLKKIKNQRVRDSVREVIEAVEAATDLSDLGDVKKITGTDNFYRIRVGEYRLGFALEGSTVDFIRCLPRRDLYKYFP